MLIERGTKTHLAIVQPKTSFNARTGEDAHSGYPSFQAMVSDFNTDRISMEFTYFRYTGYCIILMFGPEAEVFVLRRGQVDCISQGKRKSMPRVTGVRE